MYSPKIDEDLIPVLYKMARAESRPMTRIVNDIIREAIVKDRLRDDKKATFRDSRNKREKRKK